MNLRISLLLLPAALLLASCATKPVIQAEQEEPGVRVEINDLLRRAEIRKQESKELRIPSDLSDAKISVIWEGEAAEILSRIAAARKLEFKITGPKPRLQLPVFVKIKNATLEEALTVIGDQFGERADIRLFDTYIELKMKSY